MGNLVELIGGSWFASFVPLLNATVSWCEFSEMLWKLRYLGAFGLSAECTHILRAKPLCLSTLPVQRDLEFGIRIARE
jgi:hypothetical protein